MRVTGDLSSNESHSISEALIHTSCNYKDSRYIREHKLLATHLPYAKTRLVKTK